MDNRNLKVTHAYHFISEALIVYLLILPVFYHHYEQINDWIYIVIVLGLTFLYTIYAKYTSGHLFYLLSIPFVTIIFFFIGYPLGLSVTFTALLTWRYIAIRSELYLQRENMYLIVTLVLTAVGLLILRDLSLLFIYVFQLMNILLGYILSNIVSNNRAERRYLSRSIWFRLTAFFLIITTIFYLLSDILQFVSVKVWQGISGFLFFFATVLSRVVPDKDYENLIDWNQFRIEEMGLGEEGEPGPSIWGYVATFSITYIVITLLIILGGIYLIVRQLRSRVKFRDKEEVHFDSYEGEPTKNKFMIPFDKIKSLLKGKPSNPVRQLVFEFERTAVKYKKGRKPFETVEDWLQRIGLTSNLLAYQKVRYGELDVSEHEMNELKKELKLMINLIKDVELGKK